MLECEEVEPLLIAGTVPLCMQQYRFVCSLPFSLVLVRWPAFFNLKIVVRRVFGTTRVPLPEEDTIVTQSASKHIAVQYALVDFKSLDLTRVCVTVIVAIGTRSRASTSANSA